MFTRFIVFIVFMVFTMFTLFLCWYSKQRKRKHRKQGVLSRAQAARPRARDPGRCTAPQLVVIAVGLRWSYIRLTGGLALCNVTGL